MVTRLQKLSFMKLVAALVATLGLSACAIPVQKSRSGSGAPIPRDQPPPAARAQPPAVSPDMDPENLERRFGIAEAQARREAEERARAPKKKVEAHPDGAPTPPPAK
jgi:hypothetical protein